jgi:hypothetical protein
MPFPITDWPTSYDSIEDRTDGFDTVWADDYDFQDSQIRQIQTWLGTTGKLLGEDVASAGPAGMVSPVASGGTAFRLAARNSFAAGNLLTLEHDFDGTPTVQLTVDYTGLVASDGGVDFNGATIFHIPTAGTLPVGWGAPEAGRLFFKTGTDTGLYSWDGTSWLRSGGTWEGYIDGATNYAYTLAATPVEEVCGQFVFDGSKVAPGLEAVFRALVTPTFASAGTVSVRFYDLGPAAGPPSAPRLVTTLSTSSAGLAYLEQALTIVSAGAAGDEILDSARMYEITIEMTGTTADTTYIGSAGLNVEVA